MKKVLIISYYWPPAGGPGVQRWLKFAKYLPEFGFEPIVLTVDPDCATYPVRDESLLEETKGIQVYTTKTVELFKFYKKASGRKEVPYSGFANESDKPGFRQKLAKFVRGNFFIPDPRKSWNKYATTKALELIDEFGIKSIVTTSPPHSTQLIGLELKKRRKIHWLADLRDPWTDIYYYDEFFPTTLAKHYDASLELKVFKTADIVSTVSTDLIRLFKEKDQSLGKEKFLLLPNGYDESDFKSPIAKRKDGKFRLVYTGTITKQYEVSKFLELLSNEGPEVLDKLVLRFVGKRDEILQNQLERIAKSTNLEIELTGHVSHAEAIIEMRQADALLLAIPDIENNKGVLTGKIFEYLGSEKPILGIGPSKGDAALILDEVNAGKMFDYKDAKLALEYLRKLMNTDQKESSQRTQFSRRLLTEKLAKTLKASSL